jgi:hypothetical protein
MEYYGIGLFSLFKPQPYRQPRLIPTTYNTQHLQQTEGAAQLENISLTYSKLLAITKSVL